MPGAAMEPGAILCPNSQVLKGETVDVAEVWGGLPASFLCSLPQFIAGNAPAMAQAEDSNEPANKQLADALHISTTDLECLFTKARNNDKAAKRGLRTIVRMAERALGETSEPKKSLEPENAPPIEQRAQNMSKNLGITVEVATDLIKRKRAGDLDALHTLQKLRAEKISRNVNNQISVDDALVLLRQEHAMQKVLQRNNAPMLDWDPSGKGALSPRARWRKGPGKGEGTGKGGKNGKGGKGKGKTKGGGKGGRGRGKKTTFMGVTSVTIVLGFSLAVSMLLNVALLTNPAAIREL